MRVHSVCGYRSKSDEWTDKWTDVDYRARNLVKGVKREPFKGHSVWTVRATKQQVRLDNSEAGRALALRVATSKMLDLFAAAGISEGTIVPVPSSQTVVPGGDFTGNRLARAINGIMPKLVVAPVLHFNAPQPRARTGGARRWQEVLPHLRGDVDAIEGPVILLDDVMTSGGHLRACARYLHARGHQVDDAFVIGRTVWAKPPSMFSMPVEQLEL